MAVRVSLIILCLIVYSGTGSDEAGLSDVVIHTYSSLLLFIFFFWYSTAWWSQSIAIIEMSLILIGSSVVYNWEGEITPIDIYYTSLHDAAIIAEIAILSFSAWSDRRDSIARRNSRHSGTAYHDLRNRSGSNL